LARAHARPCGLAKLCDAVGTARWQDRDTLQRTLEGAQPTCHFFNSFFINRLFKDARKYCFSARRRPRARLSLLRSLNGLFKDARECCFSARRRSRALLSLPRSP
jgi:hypothetical protein